MSEKVYVNICDTKKCPGPVYAVKTGDTLYSIAQRHHCRVRTLLDLNPFVDIYNLQPGEEICVPDCRGQGNEGKNLTESINDALRKGLVEYL